MPLIAFTLSMPSNNSWNGKWTGEANLYCRVVNLTKKIAERVTKKGYYTHSFGDGWVAGVTVKAVDAKTAQKLRKQSRGFCGYDWMIDNIITHDSASDKEAA